MIGTILNSWALFSGFGLIMLLMPYKAPAKYQCGAL